MNEHKRILIISDLHIPYHRKDSFAFLKEIKKHKPKRIVIEATGRLEMPFILACAKAHLPFTIANPIPEPL